MKFRSVYILIVLFMGLTLTASAEEHYDALFDQANQAYKAGQYDSAKTLYSEIAQNGMVSPELFYNIGNTHFKLGNIPASILFYERALRLDPNNEDIQYNLDIANGFITDKIEPIDQVFFVKWWNGLARSFSSTFWGILFLSLLLLGATLLTFFFVAQTPRIRQLGLLGGAIVLISSSAIFLLGRTSVALIEQDEAVVFAASVNVKSEPSLNGTDQFVIHSGLKVEVLETDGDWSRIELSDGNSGWLPTQSIEEI